MQKKYEICKNILPIRLLSSTVVPLYEEKDSETNKLFDKQFHWTETQRYTVMVYEKEINTCVVYASVSEMDEEEIEEIKKIVLIRYETDLCEVQYHKNDIEISKKFSGIWTFMIGTNIAQRISRNFDSTPTITLRNTNDLIKSMDYMKNVLNKNCIYEFDSNDIIDQSDQDEDIMNRSFMIINDHIEENVNQNEIERQALQNRLFMADEIESAGIDDLNFANDEDFIDEQDEEEVTDNIASVLDRSYIDSDDSASDIQDEQANLVESTAEINPDRQDEYEGTRQQESASDDEHHE